MKKILLVLISILCVFSSSVSIFADEESAYDKIILGKAGELTLGQVIELPIGLDENDDYENVSFMVIGKDEDGRNTVTLMAIDNFLVSEDLGDENGICFTKEALATANITYANSTLKAYRNYVLETLSDDHQNFLDRIQKVTKNYKNADGSVSGLKSEFFYPSLTELGFTNTVSCSGSAYSLFTSKNLFTVMDEKSIDTGKAFNMWTRDTDATNHLVYAIDHSDEDGVVSHDYSTQAGRDATHNFGICFVVSYDEDLAVMSEAGVKNVKLYTSSPSEYYVSIPTKVFLNSEGDTEFKIYVYGDLNSADDVVISASEQVTLTDDNTSAQKTGIKITSAIDEAQTSYFDIEDGEKHATTITLTPAETITAGNWSVNLPITISIQ